MDNIIVNSKDIKEYNNSLNSDDEMNSSFGSISSMDERDVKLLCKNDVNTQFDALKKINKFLTDKMKDKIEMNQKEMRQNR